MVDCTVHGQNVDELVCKQFTKMTATEPFTTFPLVAKLQAKFALGRPAATRGATADEEATIAGVIGLLWRFRIVWMGLGLIALGRHYADFGLSTSCNSCLASTAMLARVE